MARLEIEGLCKGWDFPVIDRLDLIVEEGEFFVIVGPSGIGKTTLLRLVAGLEQPDAGTIRVGGRVITNLPPYSRNVAMTFESYALYPHLTVFENIASPLRARRTPAKQIKSRVESVARLLRIEPLLQRRPGEISGGQKQRTALGRTLVADPDVFLLDEPISHLDAKIRHELRLQFHKLEDLRSVATLYVTHDYAEALSLGDRIGVMGGGKLVQVGTARDIFQSPANLFVAQHLGQPTINIWNGLIGDNAASVSVRAPGGEIKLPTVPAHRDALGAVPNKAITLGVRPQAIQVVPQSSRAKNLIDAEVEIFEALGSTGVLVARSAGLPMTALTSPDMTFDHGEPVRLKIAPEGMLFFDSHSGANLLAR